MKTFTKSGKTYTQAQIKKKKAQIFKQNTQIKQIVSIVHETVTLHGFFSKLWDLICFFSLCFFILLKIKKATTLH